MLIHGQIGHNYWICWETLLANTLFLDHVWNEIIVQSIPTEKGCQNEDGNDDYHFFL